MLHFDQTINCPISRFAAFGVPAGQVLFFDIETTGFSPDSSYVYLIGCAFLEEDVVKLRQWFLDDISEEKQLVREFGEFCKKFRMLVHYNGSTFDLPYLQKKVRRHRLPGTYFCAAAVTDFAENTTGSMCFSGTKTAADATQKEDTPQQSFDIYKSLLPCKKLLGLKDLKQKTVEQFLGISRKDMFGGGDLISVYTEFVGRYRYECVTHKNPFREEKNTESTPLSSPTDASSHQTPSFSDTGLTKMPESPAKALLYVLLLHNHEDITGLLAISALTCIPKLLSGAFSVTELCVSHGQMPSSGRNRTFRLDTALDPALLLACFATETVKLLPVDAPATNAPDCSFAVSLSAADTPKNSDPDSPSAGSLTTADAPAASASDTPAKSLLLTVPVLSGTLKYFFEDYKEYYYLPLEDCAMHKSVAQFVEKEYRKKATRETCYQKKEGFFLPQPEEIITPAFRLHAKDRFSYFEAAEDALKEPATLKKWAQAMLAWLFAPS